jgi:hypothetical protein
MMHTDDVIFSTFLFLECVALSSGLLLGRVSDWLERYCSRLPCPRPGIGRKVIVVFGCLCFMGALGLTAYLKQHPATPPLVGLVART